MEEELGGAPVREDGGQPGKVVNEVHDGDLRLSRKQRNDERAHLDAPDGYQVQY